MKTAAATDPQSADRERKARPKLGLAPADTKREEHDHSIDATQGRQIGSYPYDDATQGRQIGSHPHDDATQARRAVI
jgi:hypothetical protein